MWMWAWQRMAPWTWRARRTAATLLTLASLSACSPRAAAPPAAGAGESVSLRFGWPVGMQAQVQTDAVRQRAIGGQTREGATTTTYALAVRADADGVLVQSYDVRSQIRSDGASPEQQALLGFFARASASLPSLVVGPSGQVVALRGVAELRRDLASAVNPLVRANPDQADAVQQSFDTMFAEERIAASVAGQWTPIVGAWAGANLVIGQTYEGSDQQPGPLVPDMPIVMAYEYRITRRLPCAAGGAGLECVEIRLVSRPTEEALPAIRASMQQLFTMNAPQGAAMPDIDDLTVENTLLLVTEPATLRPHRLVQERTVSGTVRQAQQPDVAVRQVERAESSYRYR